jgi:hypothetical protein
LSGSGLAYDVDVGGDTIYAAIRATSPSANNSLWAYSISGNSWTEVKALPASAASGSSIVRVGGYVYYQVGGTQYYYRYKIADNTWETLATIPNESSGAAGAQEKINECYIALVPGKTRKWFYMYNISDDSWTVRENLPDTVTNANDRLVFDGSYLYMIRGSTTNAFWRNDNIDVAAPEAPDLISPENGEEIFDTTPTLDWADVSDPSGVTYQIQIDDDEDFSSPVYNVTGLTESTYTVPDELQLFVKYYWHVRAKDGANNVGDWSDTWNFTVVPMGAVGMLLMPLLMLLPFALMLWRQNKRYHY